jgi:hypothetical protein
MKTYRTYIRYASTQKVSHKTTTWNEHIALDSFDTLLLLRPPDPTAAAVLTCDGKNMKYVPLGEGKA